MAKMRCFAYFNAMSACLVDLFDQTQLD